MGTSAEETGACGTMFLICRNGAAVAPSCKDGNLVSDDGKPKDIGQDTVKTWQRSHLLESEWTDDRFFLIF